MFMDHKKSPDHISPDHIPPTDSPSPEQHMATLVAHSHVPNLPGSAGINKRYRPAPAKTFQCRGYGECRMVFSRSEHLARHIRKHTGERPFTCHCGKQFSRLDNLRQHAQTVHADKQDQNERMMRDLTSLHATMAAANKVGHSRGGRRAHAVGSALASAVASVSSNGMNLVKQEDLSLPMHQQQRPGTSTGYEGDHNGIIYQGPTTWHVQTSDMDRPNSRPTNNHSFRDPGQSFLAPSPATPPTSAQSQSFLPFAATFNFGLSDGTQQQQQQQQQYQQPQQRDAGRPGSSSSRPPTAGGSSDSHQHPRSLPPLAAVVSGSLPSPPPQPSFPTHQQQQSPQHVLPFPGSLALRRPSTATRPGTAPASASFYSAKPPHPGGPGLVPRPELLVHHYGRPTNDPLGSLGYDADLASPTAGPANDSPFSFHPPALADTQQQFQQQQQYPPPPGPPQASPPANPRKRPFAGPDGPHDDPALPSSSSSSAEYYDYGSESRPQSRRLSVMELCNDPDANAGLGAFLLSAAAAAAGAGSRPNTSSGLVSSTSTLALVDRATASPPVLARAPPPAAGPAQAGPGGGGYGGGQADLGGGGVSPAPRRGVPPPAASSPPASPSPAALLSYRGAAAAAPAPPPAAAAFPDSPTFSGTSSVASYSPRSPFAAAARSPLGVHAPSPDAAPVHRRGGAESQCDQVRIAVSPAHSSSPLGMRV